VVHFRADDQRTLGLRIEGPPPCLLLSPPIAFYISSGHLTLLPFHVTFSSIPTGLDNPSFFFRFSLIPFFLIFSASPPCSIPPPILYSLTQPWGFVGSFEFGFTFPPHSINNCFSLKRTGRTHSHSWSSA